MQWKWAWITPVSFYLKKWLLITQNKNRVWMRVLPRFHFDCLHSHFGNRNQAFFCYQKKWTLPSSTSFNFPRRLRKSTASALREFSRDHRWSAALSSRATLIPLTDFYFTKEWFLGDQFLRNKGYDHFAQRDFSFLMIPIKWYRSLGVKLGHDLLPRMWGNLILAR